MRPWYEAGVCTGARPKDVCEADRRIVFSNAPCKHGRGLLRMGQTRGTDDVFVFQGCASNEADSLIRRHLVPLGKISKEYVRYVSSFVNYWADDIGKIVPWSPNQVIRSRPSSMRKKYTKAFTTTISKHHSYVLMFIKYEKMHKRDKAPRAIQYRNSIFTARFARYILAIESAIYKSTYANQGHRIFAKGRNQRERAGDLLKGYLQFAEPCIYLADHKAFDSSVQPFHLFATHVIYERMVGDRARDYYRCQYYNKGYTKFGTRYECDARRMSGDADTALGNSIVNYFTLKFMFGEDSVVYCDGDDSVVFTPKGVKPACGTGFNTAINEVKTFEEIEFCQCKPMLTEKNGWIMAREPVRAVTRMLTKCGQTANADYVYTVGVGEAMASPEVPVIGDVIEQYMRIDAAYRPWLLEYQTKVGKVTNQIRPPTNTSTASYGVAHDMPSNVMRAIGQSIVMHPKLAVRQRPADTIREARPYLRGGSTILLNRYNTGNTAMVPKPNRQGSKPRKGNNGPNSGQNTNKRLNKVTKAFHSLNLGVGPRPSVLPKAFGRSCALTPASQHWVSTYVDPCGNHDPFPGPPLIPDGAIPQAAPARFAFAETIVPPWDGPQSIVDTNNLYSMLILQAPFFRSLAYVVVHRKSGEFTNTVMAAVQDALGGAAEVADVTYPNWLATTYGDDDGPLVYVTSLAPTVLAKIQPPNALGVSDDISQYRDTARGMVAYFNAPDLLNQGTVVCGQFNFNVSQHTMSAEGSGELVLVTATIYPAQVGVATVFLRSSDTTVVPERDITWQAPNNSTSWVSDHILVDSTGTSFAVPGDVMSYAISVADANHWRVDLRNDTTSVSVPVGVLWSNVNTVQTATKRIFAVGINDSKVNERRFTGITMPPITQGDLAQQDPNNEIQLMKTAGGVYMPLRVFQPVYNMQNSAGFAPFAFMTRESTLANVNPTGYGDSYDRNFAIGVINMQSIPWVANPFIKIVNHREIVTTQASMLGAFNVKTGDDDEYALRVARTFTNELPHAFPANYNGFGTLFKMVSGFLDRLPAMAGDIRTMKEGISQCVSSAGNIWSIARDRRYVAKPYKVG